MLRLLDQPARGGGLCDGVSRREWMRIGGLGALGLSLPAMMAQRAAAENAAKTPGANATGLAATPRRAKACIVLFLLGGPPQHETWDPKPDAPVEIRGDLRPIQSSLPGLAVGECMPKTAKLAHRVSVLRAVRTADNAHSTSGYYMSTGIPHLPAQVENAAPGAPNNWPCLGALVRKVAPQRSAVPSAVTLPEIAANDGGKTWPGQDAGFLGRACDPWIMNGDPSAKNFEVPDLVLPTQVSGERFDGRRDLLREFDRRMAFADRGGSLERYNTWQQQAFDLVRSREARQAFDLSQEPVAVRERYGMTRFGQSVLLARRLVEAGVSLVQVNWTRIEGAPNNGHWDTHGQNTVALRDWLMPRMDQAYSALLEDLAERGLWDDTLVAWMGEFGRTPKINPAGGRDHWGNVFSIALSGGGVKEGCVHGESDRLAGEPRAGLVTPPDVTATIFHSLGISPDTPFEDHTGRPHPVSRGRVIREVLG